MRYPDDLQYIYLSATPLDMFTLGVPEEDAVVGSARFFAAPFFFAMLFSRQESRGKTTMPSAGN